MSTSASAQEFPDPAARVCNRTGRAPVVLLCDHATNAIPAALGDLGLSGEQLETHVAYDPGAAALTEAMARALDAPYVLCGYSRLLIDVNREPQAADSVVVENDGIRVPGNAGLSEQAYGARVAQIYEPYHAAVDALLEQRRQAGETPAVVAVHSFTPRIGGRRRPWDIGLIFNRDRRLARALVGELVGASVSGRLTVGLNEPYSPDDRVYHTLARHAETRGLPCVMIEVPNDQLAGPDDQEQWADRLSQALRAALPEVLPAGAAPDARTG